MQTLEGVAFAGRNGVNLSDFWYDLRFIRNH